MKKIILIVVVLVLSVNTYPQFKKVIFQKSVNINYAAPNVYKLCDINNDGYDDILIFDCLLKEAMIYLGGNPMDTIPKYTIQFSDTILFNNVAVLDINDDGVNDLLIATVKYLKDIGFHTVGDIRIFYGGSKIDTIPNLIFHLPKGATGGLMHVLKDFNGDGRSELVIYDPSLPNQFRGQSGINYFYNTGAVFDTIPTYTIRGDSLKGIQIYAITNSGDINGDGKTDLYMQYSDSTGGRYKYYTKFYLGNANFDLTPVRTYSHNSSWFASHLKAIVKDMNRDGKGDFLVSGSDGKYPYYYGNSIIWGNFPVDTIPDVGLNTQNTFIQIVTDAGDINGDGANDLFVRTNSGFDAFSVRIWLGGKQMPYKIDDVADKIWYTGEEGFGQEIAAVGDVTGDGIDDVCIQQIPLTGADACKASIVYILQGDTSAKGDTVTAIGEVKNRIPMSYMLNEPYPNPFNPSTIISWQLAKSGRVILKLYDITGREITELLNEEQSVGEHKIEFDGGGKKLSSSIYFIQMQVMVKNKIVFTQTKKLSLLK